ncbi:Na-translocating system protein MpsC family protein [Lentibacillus salinarum]|uniref:Na-translocating system protein MpsC family protein n=1 Tax=Lentibacillus salinarum TaxID=446820 RepID=A0ABW3ZQ13_9BACI
MNETSMSTLTSTETQSFKKDIAQVYNKINQEFYATGVRSQRIQLFGDRIIIFAQHKRVPALTALSKNFSELASYTDAALIAEFKSRLKEKIKEMTGLTVIAVLKDYDTVTEHACCVIYFDKKLI